MNELDTVSHKLGTVSTSVPRHCERSEAIQSLFSGLPRRYAPRNDGKLVVIRTSSNTFTPFILVLRACSHTYKLKYMYPFYTRLTSL